jgi:hypothetical protein
MTDLELATAAIVTLTEHGIPPDVQELLVYGNPSRGIAPGALSKAIRAVALEALRVAENKHRKQEG